MRAAESNVASPWFDLQISPFGVIPKSHQRGKWRLILDLSSPRGRSVKDSIDPQLCSLMHANIDDAVRWITESGLHTLLAKLVIKSA